MSSFAAKDDSLPPCERIGAMTAVEDLKDLEELVCHKFCWNSYLHLINYTNFLHLLNCRYFRNFAAIICRFRIDPVSPMRSEARKGLEPLWENQTSVTICYFCKRSSFCMRDANYCLPRRISTLTSLFTYLMLLFAISMLPRMTQ